MIVNVIPTVSAWVAGRAQAQRNIYNTKCTEAANNDLSTWRNVGRGNYDCRLDGDLRLVASKTGGVAVAATDTFTVSAIYRHADGGGKTLIVGTAVPTY